MSQGETFGEKSPPPQFLFSLQNHVMSMVISILEALAISFSL